MKWIACLCFVWFNCTPLGATVGATWHCSQNQGKQNGLERMPAEPQPNDIFMLSSAGTIDISLMDLINVYSGGAVSLGGLPLTACFMAGNSDLNAAVLQSLGLQTSVMQALSRKNSIVGSHFRRVLDEEEMKMCIGSNFPAVGYLSQPVENEAIGPCF